MPTPKRKRQNNSSCEGALPAGEGCHALVLAPTATIAARGRLGVRVHEGEEIAGLRSWVRRYVEAVLEADAAARACGDAEKEEDAGP